MKKILVLAFIAALSVSSLAPAASASVPKAGTKCTKVGKSLTSGNKKVTCIKVKKKLVWSKAVTVSVPSQSQTPSSTPTATPTPTPTETPFQAMIPIPLPVAQDKGITFENAVSNYDRIPEVAWQNVQAAIAANKDVDIPTTILIGPNTDTTLDRIVGLLKQEYRLWAGFQPPSYAGLVYNATDELWAEGAWPRMAADLKLTDNPSAYIPNHLRAGCGFDNGVATECWGGMALTFQNSDSGFAFYGVQSPYWSASSNQFGPISQVTHEYTHNVQFAQWLGVKLKAGQGSRSQAAHAAMPCWFSEGQANAIGIPIVSPDVSSYLQGRDNSVRRRINDGGAIKPALTNYGLTADAIGSFLYNQDIDTCYNPNTNSDWQLGYNVGYAATEVLVAIGGPQSTMALLSLGAEGKTWPQAFQTVYGISWKDASVVIGKVLEAEYLAKPMNH